MRPHYIILRRLFVLLTSYKNKKRRNNIPFVEIHLFYNMPQINPCAYCHNGCVANNYPDDE